MHPGPWRAATDLVWTRYDDSSDWAVFNPRSGDVHLLTDAARFLWQSIAERELATRQLLTALAAHVDRPVDDDLSSAATDTLAFMDHAGLITPGAS
jgi:PqqD family protein of HPr-rel-A system